MTECYRVMSPEEETDISDSESHRKKVSDMYSVLFTASTISRTRENVPFLRNHRNVSRDVVGSRFYKHFFPEKSRMGILPDKTNYASFANNPSQLRE